jgi:peptidoglycan/xylan/chitin deacetylase (PgdA/CDA1 family)
MVIGTIARRLSPAGPAARLSILIFHRVLPAPDPLFPDEFDARSFDALCGWVRRWFRVMSLDDALSSLNRGRLPAAALAITFDDGYADNQTVALPILQRHRLPATFFVATGFLNGGRMWNDSVIEAIRRFPGAALDLEGIPSTDLGVLGITSIAQRRSAIGAVIAQTKYLASADRDAVVAEIARRAGVKLPDDLMMTSRQLLALRDAGMQIGAHTVSHPILARLPAAEATREIVESKRGLEAVLGNRVGVFAYPNGKPGQDYLPEHAAMARAAGFDAAVSTAWGTSSRDTDRFQLPRFTPWERGRLRFGLRLLSNLARPPLR